MVWDFYSSGINYISKTNSFENLADAMLYSHNLNMRFYKKLLSEGKELMNPETIPIIEIDNDSDDIDTSQNAYFALPPEHNTFTKVYLSTYNNRVDFVVLRGYDSNRQIVLPSESE